MKQKFKCCKEIFEDEILNIQRLNEMVEDENVMIAEAGQEMANLLRNIDTSQQQKKELVKYKFALAMKLRILEKLDENTDKPCKDHDCHHGTVEVDELDSDEKIRYAREKSSDSSDENCLRPPKKDLNNHLSGMFSSVKQLKVPQHRERSSSSECSPKITRVVN